jgi:hypothetical protein
MFVCEDKVPNMSKHIIILDLNVFLIILTLLIVIKPLEIRHGVRIIGHMLVLML